MWRFPLLKCRRLLPFLPCSIIGIQLRNPILIPTIDEQIGRRKSNSTEWHSWLVKEKFSAVSIVVNGFYHVHSIVHPENKFVSSIKSDTKWVRKIGRYYGDTICAM